MRVAIDARIPAGFTGGVAQVVTGLAEGFAAAAPPHLDRVWITYPGHEAWLDSHIPQGDRLVELIRPVERFGLRAARRYPRTVSRLRPGVERLMQHLPGGEAEGTDRMLRGLGVDLVHLPFQDGLGTSLPTLYHPHDLQHVYLPEHFTRSQIHHRETVWRRHAEDAAGVSVGTQQVADDLMAHWGIRGDKIHVVPLGAPKAVDLSGSAPRRERPLILYPAAFWPHKDHLTLVRAAGLVRAIADLLMPGAPMGTFESVRAEVKRMDMDPDQVMPGYLTEQELSEAYARAAVVVVPSRFESASFPVWEAFARSIPVIVARTTALPQQAGKGGWVFEPGDSVELSHLLTTLLHDEERRKTMGREGRERASAFTWERTVLATTALYRQLTGGIPRPEERAALNARPTL